MSFKRQLVITLIGFVVMIAYDAITKLQVFNTNKNFNNKYCSIIHFDDITGLEDFTRVYEDDKIVDLIGAWENRRESWMNHDFRVEFPNAAKTGLVHIQVDKTKKKGCTSQNDFKECVHVHHIPNIDLKDASLLFNPHGIWYDKESQKLYVINHGHLYGGDRIEVFKVTRKTPAELKIERERDNRKKEGTNNKKDESPIPSLPVITVSHVDSIVHGVGFYPAEYRGPFPWSNPFGNGVAPVGSAYGIMNDLTIDKVNNRLIISTWKPFPSRGYFPRKETWEDKYAHILISLFVGDSTVVLSCPLESTAPAESPSRQCIRAHQRFGVANGVVSNAKGNQFFLADFARKTFHVLNPNKFAGISEDEIRDGVFSPFETVGTFYTSYSIDNMEVSSENDKEICFTTGGGQRLIEPAVMLEKNRFSRMASNAQKFCCQKDPQTGLVSGDIASVCKEEVLFLTDALFEPTQMSGISVATTIDNFGDVGHRLFLAGSFFTEGLTVCLIGNGHFS